MNSVFTTTSFLRARLVSKPLPRGRTSLCLSPATNNNVHVPGGHQGSDIGRRAPRKGVAVLHVFSRPCEYKLLHRAILLIACKL